VQTKVNTLHHRFKRLNCSNSAAVRTGTDWRQDPRLRKLCYRPYLPGGPSGLQDRCPSVLGHLAIHRGNLESIGKATFFFQFKL
jgi:hypothetical protein